MQVTEDITLGRYPVLRELGRGALGAVYAARDHATGAVVALKTLDPALASRPGAKLAERFLRHARSARRLKHRNIARIHAAGEAGGAAFVAMEMLEGESLRSMLDAAPLPLARAIRIARDIAGALAYAHLEGVVHGGLAPSNVIVLRSGAVKLADFGIAQLAPRAAGPAYLSPEQVRGDPVDHRCDLFSLGAILYEMLAHRPPFQGDAPQDPPPPSEFNPLVPRALDELVFSMLARQPQDRLPGAPIVLRELQRLEDGLGLGSSASAGADEPPASVAPAAPEPARRRRPAGDASGFRIDPESLAVEKLPPRLRISDDDAIGYHKSMLIMERESRRVRSSGSRHAVFLGLALAVLAIGLAVVPNYLDPSEQEIAASRAPEAPPTAPAASIPAAPAPAASPPAAPAPAASPPAAPAPAAEAPREPDPAPALPPASPPAAEPAPPAQSEAAAEAAPAPARPSRAKVAEPQPAGTARLILAVSPQGEIYIDGKHYGTTPPITTFELEPGMHRIEVRSGSRRPYLTYMTVQAGEVRRIRHDFNAKARPAEVERRRLP